MRPFPSGTAPAAARAVAAAVAVLVLLAGAACEVHWRDMAPGDGAAPSPTRPPRIGVAVYTSEPPADFARLAEAFTRHHPGVRVSSFTGSSDEVVDRVRAEAAAGRTGADVVLVADRLGMESLKAAGILARYRSPQARAIDPVYADPDGTFTGTKLIAAGLAVNTHRVRRPPTSWRALSDPARGRPAVMADPARDGPAAYGVAVIADDPDLGWAYWERATANGLAVTGDERTALDQVESGRRPVGLSLDFLVERAARVGAPVAFAYPDEGVPVLTEPIALTRDAAHPRAARQFVDFVLSAAGQQVASDLGYVPIRPGVPVPHGRHAVGDLKVIGNAEDPRGLASKIGAVRHRFAALDGGTAARTRPGP